MYTSAGQAEETPLQVSGMSQLEIAERQTVPCEANWQLWQQSSFLSSQTAAPFNLQVVPSQHGSLAHSSGVPQSHCSPSSRIPLPQTLVVVSWVALTWGALRHCPSLEPMVVQMALILHGENMAVTACSAGFMIYLSAASQVEVERGQQAASLTPCADTQDVAVQS